MGGGGGRGVGEKKVNLMSKISEYHLHIILLLIKYVCCLYGEEKSVHRNIIPDHLQDCRGYYFVGFQ